MIKGCRMGWNGRVIKAAEEKKQGQIQEGPTGVKGNSETGDLGQDIAIIGQVSR